MSFQWISSLWFLLRIGYLLCSEGLYYVLVSKNRVTLVQRLSKRLAGVNMLAVKVFQAVALNENFIDEACNNELLQYVDQAPWGLHDIDYSLLIEVTDKYDMELVDGWEKPINAGMISLVFRARRRGTDEVVIIKIKRKDVELTLQKDMEHVVGVLYLLSFLPQMNHFQVADIVHRNIGMIRNQTDFLQEVDNMNRMRDNCRHLKYVRIPKVERHVTESYPDVIVMEYLNGLKVGEVAEEDYEGFAKQVVKFGMVTTTLHGVIHGDLHCGNILFIKDAEDAKYPHKIGVIDFGIVYEIGDDFKQMLFELFMHAFDDPPRVTAEKILGSPSIVEPADILQAIPQADYLHILSLVEETIAETIACSKAANQLQIYKVIDSLYQYLNSKAEFREWGIRPSRDLVKSQMMLAMSHGVTLRLCHGDFLSLLDQVIHELFPYAMRL